MTMTTTTTPDTEAIDLNTGHLRLLLAGLAAGDSLGSTSEFADAAGVAAAYARHSAAGWPFRQVGGGPFLWAPGDPMDATDMAMCVVRTVLKGGGRFDPAAVADAFAGWLRTGPRDVGGTTAHALRRRQAGVAWDACGRDGYRANPGNAANGSLMRNGVVAAVAGDLDGAFRRTLWQAVVTLYDPLSLLCCGVQTWVLRRLLDAGPGTGAAGLPAGGPPAWAAAGAEAFAGWLGREADPAVRRWRDEVGDAAVARDRDTLAAADVSPAFDPFDPRWRSVGHGYSVLTLQVALWALAWAAAGEPYPRVPPHLPAELFGRTGAGVLGWVALVGRDSDWYGATAGPLVAAALGGLPTDMTAGLTALSEFDGLTAASPANRASAPRRR
jgi:hypothetical protein